MLDKLDEYEEGKFGELHQRILDDDGIPSLVDEMRSMKFEVDLIYDVEYHGLKHFDLRQQILDRFEDKVEDLKARIKGKKPKVKYESGTAAYTAWEPADAARKPEN